MRVLLSCVCSSLRTLAGCPDGGRSEVAVDITDDMLKLVKGTEKASPPPGYLGRVRMEDCQSARRQQ